MSSSLSLLSKFGVGFFRPAALRGLSASAGPAIPVSMQRASYAFSARRMDDAAATPGYLPPDEVTDRVLAVVRNFEKVEPGKVTPESHFVNDLGLDSLDSVELVMAFEDEFAIEIPDDAADKIASCSDAVKYISGNSNAK
eukprot:CAMPEP_0198316126 /NCGR_PEP_ID=MMETSP1450-20131203/6130_1 /TAXON_ID=753684 ORGANISM="Madagascaria erythrocladiodes, Strain CCMP3234" /NCGR_SAMPLE_ID=MMETSP1450 /ASSEMBLY_ACC=CAM_ASM_001115 /LENGTH=139 /DNA_ID=CAMNT_0044019263 /DNA_START=123 /DNA_END=542 /DNA_ORIENTATION=+